MTKRPVSPKGLTSASLLILLGLTSGIVRPQPASAQAACPDDGATERGWIQYRAGELPDALRSFEQVLGQCPEHVGALIGAAYTDLRLDRVESARSRLEAAIGLAPENGDALKGLARLDARSARFEQALARWDRALTNNPQDIEALVGMAQSLRWSGRAGEAGPYLARAHSLNPGDATVLEEQAWQRAATRIATRLSITLESDSDDNRIVTTEARAALPVLGGVRLEWQSYLRSTAFGDDRDRLAVGHKLMTRFTTGSGWTAFGELGGSQTSVLGQSIGTDLSIRISSPATGPVQGTLGYVRAPRDYTSTMIERGVRTSEFVAGVSWRGQQWESRVDGAFGTYRGTESNDRWEARASVERSLNAHVRVGGNVRGFGFERDIRDGYFDPGSFVMIDFPVEYRWQGSRWDLSTTAAPGLQKNDRTPGWSFAPRTSLSLEHVFAPGRSLTLTGSWARADAARLSDRMGRYRYASIGLGGNWVF